MTREFRVSGVLLKMYIASYFERQLKKRLRSEKSGIWLFLLLVPYMSFLNINSRRNSSKNGSKVRSKPAQGENMAPPQPPSWAPHALGCADPSCSWKFRGAVRTSISRVPQEPIRITNPHSLSWYPFQSWILLKGNQQESCFIHRTGTTSGQVLVVNQPKISDFYGQRRKPAFSDLIEICPDQANSL